MDPTQVRMVDASGGAPLQRLLGMDPDDRLPERRQPGSFFDTILRALRRKGIPEAMLTGGTPAERYRQIAGELLLKWWLRLRLLKQVEQQLVYYHGNDESYRFMGPEDFSSWAELEELLYEVAPVEIQARITRQYSLVPALHLPFFRPSPLEERVLRLSELDNKAALQLEGESTIRTLTALLEGIEAPERSEDAPLLEVLGTLCRPVLQTAMLRRLNRHFRWQYKDFDAMSTSLEKLPPAEVNLVLEGLSICLPFAGNGEMAVAAMREFLALKSELGLILDRDGNPLSYKISHDKGQLLIRKGRSKVFKYQVEAGPGGYRRQVAKELSRVQEAVFGEMKRFLSRNLFGVARNRNELIRCRYRLWSELMDYVYYQPESDHEHFPGFPDLESNLRQGNPLLSRYSLESDLRKMLKGNRLREGLYLSALRLYCGSREADNRREARGIFTDLEQRFRQQLWYSHPEYQKLKRLERELVMKASPLFDLEMDAEQAVQSRLNRLRLEERIRRLRAQIEEPPPEEQTFEWRYAFPEALDPANGQFRGFDLLLLWPPEEELHELLPDAIDLCRRLCRKGEGLAGLLLPDDTFKSKTWTQAVRKLKTAGNLNKIGKADGQHFGEKVTGKLLVSLDTNA